MTLVAGVDTSTQSCKVLVVDAASGEVVRQGAARHPAGTECPPDAWWSAFHEAAAQAGGLADVAAIGGALGAGTNCGSCRPALARLLIEEASSAA